ncbi:uncharacterized protein LOC135464075 [Liolophura sinensis]|uniref:uncharacterized protein LOC135464075 n=1 Tax=Liolophura sinensis TaxID=3198878 RepID=UPI0031585FD7
MANRVERILWSRRNLSLEDFLETHEKNLPKIIILKQSSPALGDLQKEQILRVHKVCKQQRLTAKNSKNEVWSIPLDYHIKVRVLRQGQYLPAQNIADISEALPVNVRFEEEFDGKFHFAGEVTNVELGLLTIESLSEETYLLGNCINKGTVDGRVVAIPTNCDVIVGVAEGFGRDEAIKKDWLTFQNILASVIEEFNMGHVAGCAEIRKISQSKPTTPDRVLLCTPDPDKIISYPQVTLDERLPPEPPPVRPSRPRTFEKINENRDVAWSTEHYTLKEFFDKFSQNLPQIVVVTSGFYGLTDLETFGVDEIVRIKQYARQKRVIAMDPTEQYLSIPLTYPVKMEILKEHGKVSIPISLESIINNYSLPIRVRFSRKDSGNFVSQADSSSYAMRELELQECYSETYYLGNSLCAGEMNPKVTIMPVYIDISVAVAQGWKKKPAEEWEKYLLTLEEKSADVNYDIPAIDRNIAVYSPGQVNAGENIYEYIIPSDYISIFEEEKPLTSPKSPMPHPSNVKTKAKPGPKANYAALVPQPSVKNTYVSLSQKPSVRPLPETPGDVPKVKISPKISTLPKSFPTFFPLEEPVPSKTTSPVSPNPTSAASPTSPKPVSETELRKHKASLKGIKVLPMPSSAKDTTPRTRVNDSTLVNDKRQYCPHQYANSIRGGDMSLKTQTCTGAQTGRPGSVPDEYSKISIKKIQDIPHSISYITVEELCDCLKLLHLNQYVDSFRNLNIDGNLLMDLTVDDLQNDPNFHMSITEAKMLVRFARNGWRPKHS